MNKEKYMEWVCLLKEIEIVLEKIHKRKNKNKIQNVIVEHIE